jgi:hypothetical protein
MNLQAATIVWGRHHVDLFKNTTLKSLSWPKNRDLIQKVNLKWNIYTDAEFFDEIKNAVQEAIPEIGSLAFKGTERLRTYSDPVQSAMVGQIENCLEHNEKLFLFPPDTIFGDGSLEGLLESGLEDFSCVVSPHPRVNPSIIETLTTPLTNPQLVTRSWEHLHRAWTDAEIGHHHFNFFYGGVKWQRLSEKQIEVTHLLPTIYLAHFREEDLKHFKLCISFGDWDHVWPSMLVQQNRQRFIKDSDRCFIVEVTEKDKNVPPPPYNQENFWKNDLHNQHNSKIKAIFRGE